jgi:hypothetical protein
MVSQDRACVRCSYNLRGLPIEGNCPECGTPVQDSLKGILLQFATSEYRAKITSGLSFILNGILLMVIAVVCGIALSAAIPRQTGALLSEGLQFIASIIITIGYWKYTEPDPGFVGTETTGSARNVARSAVIASVVIILVQASLSATGGITAKPSLPGLLYILLAVASIVT